MCVCVYLFMCSCVRYRLLVSRAQLERLHAILEALRSEESGHEGRADVCVFMFVHHKCLKPKIKGNVLTENCNAETHCITQSASRRREWCPTPQKPATVRGFSITVDTHEHVAKHNTFAWRV